MGTRRSNGEGTITKTPAGTFRVQVTMNGQRTGITAKTRKEAVEWMRNTHSQMDKGLKVDGMRTPFTEVLDSWLAVKETKRRLSTMEQYRRIVAKYIKPALGNRVMRELNAAVIQAVYTDLLEKGTGKRTIEIVHTVIHGALGYALRLGLVTTNWADLTEAPRPEKTEMQVWNESQVSQFLIGNPDLIFRMALTTGMRRGELLGLKWEDLDWRTGSLTIRRQVYEPEGGGWRFQEPKTYRGRRSVKVGKSMLAALRDHYNNTLPTLRAVAGDAWQENDLIFPSAKGTPRNGYQVSKEFHRAQRAAGLPEIRLHDCRHTAASLMLMHGIPPIQVAQILGQSVAVLLDTYSHFIPGGEDRVTDLMDGITTPTSIDIRAFSVQLSNETVGKHMTNVENGIKNGQIQA